MRSRHRPLSPRTPRRRRVYLAILGGLLQLALALSQARAQTVPARVFLPLVARPAAPVAPGAPRIDSFQIDVAAGPMGAEVELRWKVRDATSLSIDPLGEDVRGGASLIVRPLATTTYTLVASNASGSARAEVTYRVTSLPPADPITIVARPDPARAVSARVGPAGGTLSAQGADGTRYTLAVPPDALLYSEAITLTPALSLAGVPFAATGLRAASVAPAGLLFIAPATLTIAPPGAPPARSVGFAYQGAGADFHLRTLQLPGDAGLAQAGAGGQISVTTARSYGSADIGGDIELAPLVRRAPSDPADVAEHVVNAAIDQGLSRALRRVALIANLREEYLLLTETQLTTASNNPESPAPFDLESAVRSYISWRARVRAAGLEEQLRPEISRANLLLGEALRKAGALATQRCNAGRPEQGFALQRYSGYAKRFGLANTRAGLEERLRKCWSFELQFTSRMDQHVENISALYELAATLKLAYGPDGRIVGGAPLRWTRLDVQHVCPITTASTDSTFDATSGELGLRLQPVSRSSPSVDLRLSYTVGRPAAEVTETCPGQPPVSLPSPLWWAVYGQTHSDERAGDIYTARARAELRSFPGWAYTNTFGGGEIAEQTTVTLKHTPES